MTNYGNPDDGTLLAQLDTTAARAEAWERLLTIATEFADLPHADDDYGWTKSERGPQGVVRGGYPVYGERVERARGALVEVGAVTPTYPWMHHCPPRADTAANLTPADAVRLATGIMRGERFSDGTIGAAVESGTLQAVLASLAAWYRSRPHA
ncbi:DUF6508 domain-containing protein [Streptomyces olivoreticuli]